MTADQLELARAALLSGQREQARSLLMQFVRLNPGHGEGWYLLSQTLDDPAQRADCEARARAAGFSPAAPDQPPLVAAAPRPEPPPREFPPAPPASARAPELAAAGPPARTASKGLLAIAGGLGLVVLLALGWLGYRQFLADPPEPTLVPAPPAAVVAEPATRTPRPTRVPTTPTIAPTRPPVPTPTLPQILPVTVTPGPEGVATGGAGAANPTPTSGSPAPTGESGASGERSGRIAYSKTDLPGQINIYSADADGGNERRLTNLGGMETAPAWSPDGKQIAFIATVDRTDQDSCSAGSGGLICESELYTMNVDGTNLRRVTNAAGEEFDPSWSPDGSRIVFRSRRPLPSGNFSQLYVINADGTGEKQLTSDAASFMDVQWSPSGNNIIFTRSTQRENQIYVMDVDKDNMRQVTKNTRMNSLPAWSPDGGRIAFISFSTASGSALYIMNADGSEERLVEGDYKLLELFRPAWSPDGAELAFVGSVGGQFGLYAVEISSGSVRPIIKSDAILSAPAWSPR
jgi:tricorn protease-like protein